MRKLCSKCVQRLLTADQKQQLVDDSERCLRLFQHIKKEFLHKYVTIDKPLIYHFPRESNQQSAEWTATGESRSNQPKTQTSAGRFGLCILGRSRYFVHYLPWERRNHHFIALLVCLKEEIVEKRPQMKKIVLFHQDNAPCHKSIAATAKLHELHFKLLPHPPYTPDLAPSHCWLFAGLKRMLQQKRFGSTEKVILETEAYFETKDNRSTKKASNF